MAEFVLDICEPSETGEQRRLAHDWVARLGGDLRSKGESEPYTEIQLQADQTSIKELLEVMTLGDLPIPPGGVMGKVHAISWETDDDEDKCGLYFGGSFMIPPEPSHVYMASIAERFEPDEPLTRYVAVGMAYARGSEAFHQLIGVAAHADGTSVDALRLTYADAQRGRGILTQGVSRPISYADAWTFVDCVRELCELPREAFVRC